VRSFARIQKVVVKQMSEGYRRERTASPLKMFKIRIPTTSLLA